MIQSYHMPPSSRMGALPYNLLADAERIAGVDHQAYERVREGPRRRLSLVDIDRPPTVPEPLPPNLPMGLNSVRLLDLNRKHCRFPVGDDEGEFQFFCGEDAAPGESYCPTCAKSSHKPRKPRKIKSELNA